MNEQTHLQVQAIELQRLLDQAQSDPILGPQIQERLSDVRAKLARPHGSLFPHEQVQLPRAAIFLRGGGVLGESGIRPSLAGEALIQYERMFVEQALHDQRQFAKEHGRQRRPRGASMPTLLFTGTPRGSFGLEFVPQITDDVTLARDQATALNKVAETIVRLTSESADSIVEQLPPKVLAPLKKFLRVLAQHGAELRVASSDSTSRTVDADRIRAASERLERDVHQDTVELRGVFRGVARESGVFDLRDKGGQVISGVVADSLTEDDLNRIDALTNQECTATLEQTSVTKVGGSPDFRYVLIDARA